MSYALNTDKTWHQTENELRASFRQWARHHNARSIPWALENLRGKRDVTLRYTLPDQPEVVLTMDRQRTAEDNLRVLYLAVEAMRLNDVRGVTDVVRAAYLALPSPAIERDPYEVLGVRPDTPPEVIEAAYKALARKHHPDNGGDAAEMATINAAYERLKREAA